MSSCPSLPKSLFASGVVLLLVGCGAPTEEEWESLESEVSTSEAALLPACPASPELSEVVEHACVHAENGPFQPVTAAALGAPVLVDVSTPHTTYKLTLPTSTQSWGWAGRVSFLPDASGEFAFMLSRVRGLRIYDAATGVEVARECRYQVPADVCGALKTAIVADLQADTEYHLEFQALLSRNASFSLLIEEAAHHPHAG
ncbi:hypothetical protein MYSTI_07432 [Myxococcus stipitatus DSM 14675]|uniref:Uncharacterized protein n=1 Tax=Myxococcus stipitatus (strain DSM 14675 / JCM 12634 / Mx s8) TaxID=1278073 RepID=L7UQ67_MYXSD|nr:hypothetical protein [Myxococcus stipitatus]AGC48704.1 hypothetical protein MYSTI_07432 [Myxococcus stipitatus DSM 14675]